MGEAEQLRSEIEGTRDHLGATMVAIEEHVSPRAMVQRRRSAMAERWSAMREAVMGKAHDVSSTAAGAAHEAPSAAVQQAQGNPLVAGLVAFGAGLLAATVLPTSRTEEQAATKLAERAQPLAEEAKQVAGEVASSVREEGAQHAEQLRQEASQAAGEVAGTARSAGEDTRQAGADAARDVREQTRSG